MNPYQEYLVDKLEYNSHTKTCSWHSFSGTCTCKIPDYIIEDSLGNPIIGLSKQGYRVSLKHVRPATRT